MLGNFNATGKGFAWKIKGWVNENGLDSKSFAPIVVISPIPPWILAQPEMDTKLHENRREMVEAVSINTYVNEYIKNSHTTPFFKYIQMVQSV